MLFQYREAELEQQYCRLDTLIKITVLPLLFYKLSFDVFLKYVNHKVIYKELVPKIEIAFGFKRINCIRPDTPPEVK